MKKLTVSAAFAFILQAAIAANPVLTGPIMWEISGNGLKKPSYILGAHHTAPGIILDQIDGFATAWESVEEYAGEINLDELTSARDVFMQTAMMPQDKSYDRILTQKQYTWVDSLSVRYTGKSLAQNGHMKPEYLKMMISSGQYSEIYPASATQQAGGDVESVLHNAAKQFGKQIGAMETVHEQLTLIYATESVEEQVRSMLCHLENPHIQAEYVKNVTERYYAGDVNSVYDLTMANLSSPCPGTEEYRNAFNRERNEKWLPKIIEKMHSHPTLFAVGMLHLGGDEGILNTLAQHGYSLTPVN